MKDARHEIFIQQMLMHGDRQRAYLAAYPLTETKDLEAEAAEMENAPEIRQEFYRRRRQKEEARQKRGVGRPLLNVHRKREILSAIAEGEWQVKRHVRIKDLIVEVYEDPNLYQVMRAVELDSKLAADHYKELQYETPQPEIDIDAEEVFVEKEVVEPAAEEQQKAEAQDSPPLTITEKHNQTVVSCKGPTNYNATQPDDGKRPWKKPNMLQYVLQKMKEGDVIAHSKAHQTTKTPDEISRELYGDNWRERMKPGGRSRHL